MYHFGATESQRTNFQRVFDKHCQKATGCWTTACLKEYLQASRSPGQDISDDSVQLLWRIVIQFAYFPFQPPVGFLWLDFEALFRSVTWLSDSEYVMPGFFTRALTPSELEVQNAALTPETPGALFRIDGTLLRSPHNGRQNVRAGLSAQDFRKLVFIALSTTDAGPDQTQKIVEDEDHLGGCVGVLDIMMWLQPMASTLQNVCTEPRESFAFRASNLPRLPSTKNLRLTDDRRQSLLRGLSALQHDSAIDIEGEAPKREDWTWEDFDASFEDTTVSKYIWSAHFITDTDSLTCSRRSSLYFRLSSRNKLDETPFLIQINSTYLNDIPLISPTVAKGSYCPCLL